MALELVVSGATGRMGRALGRLIGEADDLRALGGIARASRPREEAVALGYPEIVGVGEAGPLLGRADAVIDVSAPEQLAGLLDAAGGTLDGRPLVVGTTGLDGAIRERLDALAGRGPVLVAANFSVGVALLKELAARAARALPAERYDVEVVETHHRRKADAPSGTALELGDAIAGSRGRRLDELRRDGRSGRTGERPAGEIGFHAVRGGGVAGEHRVVFLGGSERIELAHAAASRTLFAEGALTAVRWLAQQGPGRHGMRDVLGL